MWELNEIEVHLEYFEEMQAAIFENRSAVLINTDIYLMWE